MKQYHGFIFDLDGTLVDSALDFKAMRSELKIAPDAPILETVELWDSEQKLWGHQIIHRHEMRGAEVSTLIPGVLEFLELLEKKKKRIGIFTRNSKVVCEATLLKHRLGISQVMTRDDAPAKPNPIALHQIAAEWKLPLSEILFVGDYLYDLQAGLAAGMPTALYLTSPADFCTAGAAHVFSDYFEIAKWI